jgi:hypothetical protein
VKPQEQEAGEDFESVIAIQYSPGMSFAMTVHEVFALLENIYPMRIVIDSPFTKQLIMGPYGRIASSFTNMDSSYHDTHIPGHSNHTHSCAISFPTIEQ